MKGVLKEGLNEKMGIKQKQPRSEVKGSQKPLTKKEAVKGNGKTFKFS